MGCSSSAVDEASVHRRPRMMRPSAKRKYRMTSILIASRYGACGARAENLIASAYRLYSQSIFSQSTWPLFTALTSDRSQRYGFLKEKLVNHSLRGRGRRDADVRVAAKRPFAATT